MRYHFFLHYGWFFQNLGKEAVRTFMHTTVFLFSSFIFNRSLFENYKIFFEGCSQFKIYSRLCCLRAAKVFIEGIHNQYNNHSMLDGHCYNKLRHQNCCTRHYCFHHRTMNLQPSQGRHIQPLGQYTYYDLGCGVFSCDFQIIPYSLKSSPIKNF